MGSEQQYRAEATLLGESVSGSRGRHPDVHPIWVAVEARIWLCPHHRHSRRCERLLLLWTPVACHFCISVGDPGQKASYSDPDSDQCAGRDLPACVKGTHSGSRVTLPTCLHLRQLSVPWLYTMKYVKIRRNHPPAHKASKSPRARQGREDWYLKGLDERSPRLPR